MQFDIFWTLSAILLAIAVLALGYFASKFPRPTLYFPEAGKIQGSSLRNRLGIYLPSILKALSLLSLLIALAGPYTYKSLLSSDSSSVSEPSGSSPKTPPPVEGIAIYLVLDQSLSMQEKVRVPKMGMLSKLNLLKTVTKKFVAGDAVSGLEGRPNDMIGLVGFARTAQILSPLTLDHQAILKKIEDFDLMRVTDQDGTGIGYAIYKTANLIAATRHFAEELVKEGKPAYTIKNSVILLVTDGLQELNPLDAGNSVRTISIEEAAKYAAKENIKLYIVNIEPRFGEEKFAPVRREFTRYAELTGGKFFLASGDADLTSIYKEINQLEKSQLPGTGGLFGGDSSSEEDGGTENEMMRQDYAPYFILLALALLMLALLIDNFWLRRVP